MQHKALISAGDEQAAFTQSFTAEEHYPNFSFLQLFIFLPAVFL